MRANRAGQVENQDVARAGMDFFAIQIERRITSLVPLDQQVIDADRTDEAFRAFIMLGARRHPPNQCRAQVVPIEFGMETGVPVARERPDVEDRRNGLTPAPEKLARLIAIPAHRPACPLLEHRPLPGIGDAF